MTVTAEIRLRFVLCLLLIPFGRPICYKLLVMTCSGNFTNCIYNVVLIFTDTLFPMRFGFLVVTYKVETVSVRHNADCLLKEKKCGGKTEK